MTPTETLEAFASCFVIEGFRSRFLHEAIKKPDKLHGRICHHIDDVFPEKYRGHLVRFKDDDPCLVLGWGRGIRESTWGEAAHFMSRGGGLLVIDSTGRKFYAETEALPTEIWGGEP
jgi:hypothetical protein